MTVTPEIRAFLEQEAADKYPDWERGTAFVCGRSAERLAHVKAKLEALQWVEDAWDGGREYGVWLNRGCGPTALPKHQFIANLFKKIDICQQSSQHQLK